jgi:thioredoxin-like negative regulator of GroEL
MDGLVSWLYVRERKRLRLRTVNVDRYRELAERFRVGTVPTLVLVKDKRVVARLEGRVTGRQMDRAILPHLRSSATR